MKKTYRLIAVLLAFLLIVPALYLQAYANDEFEFVESTGDTDESDELNEFTVVVDYYSERLLIIPRDKSNDTDYIEIGTKTDSEKYENLSKTSLIQIKCMYALKTTSDELLRTYNAKMTLTALSKDKWYPIYGGEISIENLIPKKAPATAKKSYYIAVRAANDNFTGIFGYRTRIVIPIKARYDDKSLKNLLEYDADKQEYRLSSSVAFGGNEILVSFDNFGYNAVRTDQAIKVPTDSYFNGGSFQVKTAPILNSNGVQYASSSVVKYSIPKAGSAPAVKTDSNKSALVSLKQNKIEYCIDYDLKNKEPGTWQTYTDSSTTILYTEFKSKLGIDFDDPKFKIENQNGNEVDKSSAGLSGEYYYIIYFRTKAVDNKTPASAPKKIRIPYDEVTMDLSAVAK